MKKRICLFILIMTFLIPMISKAPKISAEEESDIKMKVTYGFENYYKLGRNMPVVIEVTNEGKDFEGYIEIEVPRLSNNEYVIYSQEVHLPSNSNKKVFFALPVLGDFNELVVTIKENKKVVYKQTTKVNKGRLNMDQLLIGILSDDFNGLNYFYNDQYSKGNYAFTYTPVTFFKMEQSSMPDIVSAFESLDAIIINNYNTSEMTNEQYEALKEWVKQGGNLIIGTGPNYSKTLSIFKDDFLSGEIGDTKKVETTFNVSNVDPITLDTQSIHLKDSTPLFGEDLVKKISTGKGTISIANFDFGLEPLSKWNGNENFASLLLGQIITSDYINQMMAKQRGMESWMLNTVLSVIATTNLPNMKVLIIVLLIYILLVGPIAYFLLKRFDKRQWLWISVPLIAIIFSGVIFSYGSETRFSKTFINKANIITLNQDNDLVMETFAGIISPNTSNVKIEIPKEYAMLPINDYDYYRSYYPGNTQSTGKKLHSIIRQKGDFTQMELFSITAFKPNYIKLISHPEFDGTLEVELSLVDNKVKGRIKNGFDFPLEDVFIMSRNMFVKVGRLENGEELKIDEKYQYMNYIYDVINSLYPNYYGPQPHLPQQQTKPSIEEQIAMRQRRGLLEMQFESYLYHSQSVNQFDFNLVAFSNHTQDMFGEQFKEYDINMFVIPFKINFFDEEGKVQLPLGYIRPRVVEIGMNTGYEEYSGIMYGDLLELEFEVDDDNIVIEEIKFGQNPIATYARAFNGDFYLYNYNEEEFELFNHKSDVINMDNKDIYVNEANQIRVRLEEKAQGNTMNRDPVSIPLISVKGRKK